jgi:Ca-activated chloride channel family protein
MRVVPCRISPDLAIGPPMHPAPRNHLPLLRITAIQRHGTLVAEWVRMTRRLWLLLFTTVSACGGGNAADSPGAGGGGVSFGGQQDIGEFRGILEAGNVPGKATLDANGFFNEHYNEPPATDCTNPLCLTPGVAVGRDWLTGQHQATLQIAVNTNVDPTTIVRKPLNLVVVVDHSGSMWEDSRMEKVKVGLHTLVDNLAEGDRIALVQFDDRVDVLAPFAETPNKTQLHTLIDNLVPRGSTNIYDGLARGFDLASTAYSNERQNRVIFLSDGMATAGNTSQSAIISMAEGYVAKGIGLTTIGVGLSFDVNLMRGLAERGAGNFYFLEDAAAATEVFTQELDYFVTPLALDVHITATAGSGWSFGEMFGSSLWSGSPTTGTAVIPAVFVASRTSQGPDPGRRGGGSMLFIRLTPTGAGGPDGKVSDIQLTYRLPGSTEIVAQKLTLAYPHDPGAEAPPAQSPYLSAPEIAERYAMFNIYLGLRFATHTISDYGATDCALVALERTKEAAMTWNATHEDPDIAADLMLIEMFLANLRANGATIIEDSLAQCGADDPYGDGDGYHDHDDYGHDHHHAGCSAGGNPRSLVVVVLAAIALVRRRRRA